MDDAAPPALAPMAQQTAVHLSRSMASLGGQSSASEWGSEHVLDSSIKLTKDTPLYELRLLDAQPTQLAVGMQQVNDKMRKVERKRAQGKLTQFLASHPIPVVRGPGGSPWLIDHHHLGLALLKCGVDSCWAGTVADWSGLTDEQFWAAMAQHHYVWPHSPSGEPLSVHELPRLLPRTLEGLADDPYRSLAALVRKAGGYQKSTLPFSEFVWANHLRQRVPLVLLASPEDVVQHVPAALAAAAHPDASHLPGFEPGAHEDGSSGGGEQAPALSDVAAAAAARAAAMRS